MKQQADGITHARSVLDAELRKRRAQAGPPAKEREETWFDNPTAFFLAAAVIARLIAWMF